MRFAVIDLSNLYFRAQNGAMGADAFTRAGLAMHITFNSLRKMHRECKVDHMVFCTEGRSWRYQVYPQYKARRRLERTKRTPREVEEDSILMDALTDLTNYLAENTRCTVLHSEGVEGDDFIARWIQLHPDDDHIIVSGDTDFFQLLAPNVAIYDGINERMIRTTSVTNANGEEMVFRIDPAKGRLKVGKTIEEARRDHAAEQKDKAAAHTKAEKQKLAESVVKGESYTMATYLPEPFTFEIEPEWWKKALFIKLVRGDAGDGIFAAYPGVRYLGSSKKIGIREAWDDRLSKGYAWNNFMLTTWDKFVGFNEAGDKVTQTVTVKDELAINELLIDLTRQPDEVKEIMDTVILQAVQKEPVKNVGVEFLRFCAKHQLTNLSKSATDHAAYLNAPYGKAL